MCLTVFWIFTKSREKSICHIKSVPLTNQQIFCFFFSTEAIFPSYLSPQALCPNPHVGIPGLQLTLQRSDKSRCHWRAVQWCAKTLRPVCTCQDFPAAPRWNKHFPCTWATRTSSLVPNTERWWHKASRHFALFFSTTPRRAVTSSSLGLCYPLEWL